MRSQLRLTWGPPYIAAANTTEALGTAPRFTCMAGLQAGGGGHCGSRGTLNGLTSLFELPARLQAFFQL